MAKLIPVARCKVKLYRNMVTTPLSNPLLHNPRVDYTKSKQAKSTQKQKNINWEIVYFYTGSCWWRQQKEYSKDYESAFYSPDTIYSLPLISPGTYKVLNMKTHFVGEKIKGKKLNRMSKVTLQVVKMLVARIWTINATPCVCFLCHRNQVGLLLLVVEQGMCSQGSEHKSTTKSPPSSIP